MPLRAPHELPAEHRNRHHGAATPGGQWFGHEDPAHVLRLQQRYRETLRLFARNGLADLTDARVLDVGCGDGVMLTEYLQWGVAAESLAGIDMAPRQVEQARRRVPSQVELVCGDATSLPWPDASFDVVSALTVFSSILAPAAREGVAGEMMRVLRPGGMVLWYDTVRENPHNPAVRAVPVDDVRRLFAGTRVDLKMISFLPHVARRWPVALLELVYSLLAALPGCASHALAALVKE